MLGEFIFSKRGMWRINNQEIWIINEAVKHVVLKQLFITVTSEEFLMLMKRNGSKYN